MTAFPTRPGPALLLSVGFLAGAVIALQIGVMRIFAVGSWAHFGSLVVGLAMLGFGLASVVIGIGRAWFERRWWATATAALLLFGPLAVGCSLLAQQLPFNAIFLVSDPAQKWRLFANLLLYLLPFLSGAFFLGIVFLKGRTGFGQLYFADLTGSGAAGLLVLAALYGIAPENILLVPLALWLVGAVLWFPATARRGGIWGAAAGLATIAASLALPALTGAPNIAVSPYKGVAYARNFPDAERIYRSISPFGDLQIYASSYMHFAPGLSDNAAFNLPELPPRAYVGMYIDGDGPFGIMRALPPEDQAYFRYLPMFYPYLLRPDPSSFVVKFGGGISTMLALRSGARRVTVAENNPAVLEAFRDPRLKEASGDILADPRLRVIASDGRLFLAHTGERYDIIDLSLADSVGLSNPGGSAIVEQYAYTREAMLSYMGALADGGILAVTLWNKEEPPKSVLKLFATMVDAARTANPATVAQAFFAVSSYLSTTTVLYRKGGFTEGEIAKLRDHTKAMSFDEIYAPGSPYDTAQTAPVLDAYRASIFGSEPRATRLARGADPTAEADPTMADPAMADPTMSDPAGDSDDAPAAVLPATVLERMEWHHLIDGGWPEIALRYVFDTSPLTNDRPYFAAFVKPADLAKTLDRLDLFQDEWGSLLLWATLAIACAMAAWLILLPLAFGRRTSPPGIFPPGTVPPDTSLPDAGRFGTILYFGCLGLGYIMVEVGLIGRFTLALANPTVSASVLITGMLLFSGLGSLASNRVIARARQIMPPIFLLIAALLVGYGNLLGPLLETIGAQPYWLRLLLCFALTAPPAFLMGLPMAIGMTWLARLGKDRMFVWAWGINGCFSVIGAAAVPIIATTFGLAAVLNVSGAAYLLAIPAFFSVLAPRVLRE